MAQPASGANPARRAERSQAADVQQVTACQAIAQSLAIPKDSEHCRQDVFRGSRMIIQRDPRIGDYRVRSRKRKEYRSASLTAKPRLPWGLVRDIELGCFKATLTQEL